MSLVSPVSAVVECLLLGLFRKKRTEREFFSSKFHCRNNYFFPCTLMYYVRTPSFILYLEEFDIRASSLASKPFVPLFSKRKDLWINHFWFQITWIDDRGLVLTEGVRTVQELMDDGKRFVTVSILKFVASIEHHGRNFTCQAQNSANRHPQSASIR